MLPRLEHDPEANAVYIQLDDKPYAYTKALDDMRYIDYAADNTPIGIELLAVSEGVVVEDLPDPEQIVKMLEGRHIKVYA